jgi:nucleoid DNA-binding protein
MTMTKTDLAREASRITGVPTGHCQKIIKIAFETIVTAIIWEEEVHLQGFGKWVWTKARPSRRGKKGRLGRAGRPLQVRKIMPVLQFRLFNVYGRGMSKPDRLQTTTLPWKPLSPVPIPKWKPAKDPTPTLRADEQEK